MKKILFRSVFAFLLIWAQSTMITAQTDSVQAGGNVNFYLDCRACDFTFVRQKLPFVSFVRDNNLADVHILVSISHTGSGAHKYFFNFIGKNRFKGMDHDYELVTDPSYTEDDTRNGLLKILQLGILPYYYKSGFIKKVDINLEGQEHTKADELVIDRWNKWIIELSSGGNFEKEESQNETSWETEVSIGKLTPDWKVKMEARYEIDRENYFDDGDKIVNNQDEKLLNAYYIKSLTPKWSAGLYGEYASSTFLNSRHSFEFDAGIEYNFFPWDESNRRIFSLAYIAGISADEYHEETIFGKMKETQPFESLLLKLELVETWGTLEVDMEGRHLFSDFSKSRLTLGADVSVRLSKHLSVFGEMETQIVHDQLYLPKGDATVEDILLRRRKLASTYEMRFNAGLRLTIGSIFSNVVNERFDLE